MAAPAAVLSILVRANTSQATTALAGTQAQLSKTAAASGRMSTAMKGAGKVGAVAVAVGLGVAVKKAADFEAQLDNLGAATGANARQMKQFRDQALKAGADTKYSALEAAKAQTELAKGGLGLRDIMKGGLKSALALAAAGEMDLAEAAGTTVNAMKLFGIRGKNSMKVADALATAARKTTADVSDFAMALKMGGSVAKLAGLSFNDTVVVLEALAEAGIKGSDAGTSMKAFFLNITRDSPKAKAAMAELGVNIFKTNGQLKSLPAISANLRSAFGSLTKEQFLQKAGTIAGSDAIRTLYALYAAGPDKLKGLSKATAEHGTATDVMAQKQDNLKGKLENLQGSMETLAIITGSVLIPPLTKAAEVVTTFLNQLSTGKGGGGAVMAEIKGIAGAANISSHDLKVLGQAASNVFKAIGAVVSATLPGILAMLRGWATVMSGIIKVLSGVLTLNFRQAWNGVKQIFSGALKYVSGQLRAATGPLRAAASAAFSPIKKIFGDVIAGVLRRLASLFDVASKIPGIGGKFKGLADKARAAATEIDGVGEKIRKLPTGKDINLNFKLNVDDAVGGPLGDLLAGRKFGQPDIPRRRGPHRKGGMVFGAGGLIPAMLSPGELGVLPGGKSFMVPGAPVAGDTVPMSLPSGTSIFTGSGQAMLAGGASMAQALARQAPHFAKGGKVAAGKYSSTSYGPPWGGIQGTGITRTGVNLKGSPHVYGVAVDPSRIALGSSLRIQPNPFGTRKPFRAFDTGGAIKGNRIDFYDWRGRGKQRGWGKRDVNVARAGSGPGGSPGSPKSGSITIPAGITHPLLGTLMKPLVDDALLGGIEAGRTGASRTGLLASVLEGIVPQSEDYATRKRFELASATPAQRRAAARSGGGGSSAVRAMVGRASAIDAKKYPYKWGGGHSTFRGPYDCSGAVSAVLHSGGLLNSPLVSGALAGWGSPGKGKHVTVYANPQHTFMALNGRGFGTGASNPGGGAGWLPYSSRPGFTVRHPKGMRRGGVVGEDLLKRIPVRARTPKVLAELAASGLMPGLRKGTPIGGLRRPRRVRGRRPPRLRSRILALAGNPGNRRAAGITTGLSGALRGRSIGALKRAERLILRKIRVLAKPRRGETNVSGEARIKIRRLQGALALVQDEMGRPIGRALQSSDDYQDIVTRSLGRLDNEIIVGGGDPDSVAGRAAKIARTSSAIGSLSGRRTALSGALARAKATGNRTAVGQVQSEINEVDDQILGLRADLTTLSKAATDQTDAIKEQADNWKALTAEIAETNRITSSTVAIGLREANRAIASMVAGELGAVYSQRRATAGDGSTLARY